MYALLLRLMFLVPPERIHHLTFAAMRLGGRVPPLRALLTRIFAVDDPILRSTVFGVDFPAPLGLAAGFDKNATGVDSWGPLGFGFAEVGTVTAQAQPGNPTPRLFRLPEDHAIVNRMGFNNVGADVVAHQWVDNGPGWAAVRLPSAEHVRDLRPDWSQAPDAKVGVIGWHEDGGEHLYETRAFVPGLGVGEDPVTGSLNAGIAQWLTGEGEVPHRWSVTQGGCIGRAGVLSLTAADDGEVRVGGAVVSLVEGTIRL